MKGIVEVPAKYPPNKFTRKTKMGGHLTSTLGRAGLSNIGLVHRTSPLDQGGPEQETFMIQDGASQSNYNNPFMTQPH